MNRSAMQRILGKGRNDCAPVAVLAPQATAAATASVQVASVEKSDGGTRQAPRARLVSLLTAWANMDEAEWTQEAVDRLRDDILDVFAAYPEQAPGWHRAWRALHPAARLA
jgi:hypothetical protein